MWSLTQNTLVDPKLKWLRGDTTTYCIKSQKGDSLPLRSHKYVTEGSSDQLPTMAPTIRRPSRLRHYGLWREVVSTSLYPHMVLLRRPLESAFDPFIPYLLNIVDSVRGGVLKFKKRKSSGWKHTLRLGSSIRDQNEGKRSTLLTPSHSSWV